MIENMELGVDFVCFNIQLHKLILVYDLEEIRSDGFLTSEKFQLAEQKLHPLYF